MYSICCNARPYEVTSIKEMSGTCNKCMKPTMFVEEKELSLAEIMNSSGIYFHKFIDSVLGNEEDKDDLRPTENVD